MLQQALKAKQRLVLRLGFRWAFIFRELPAILNEVLLRLEIRGDG